jgi:acetyl-CoA C-acetyltransferase
MVPLLRRAEVHRSPAVAVVGEFVRNHCDVAPSDIEHRDLYSCFPAAVRVQTAELGFTKTDDLTVTGGMTFGGGPLNNYTLQAMAKMVSVLRAEPHDRGLVTNVSGMLTKFGASVWSCRPPAVSFAAVDVSAAATEATAQVEVHADYQGPARVLTYTVAFDKGQPVQGIAIAETSDGGRCLSTTTDASLMTDMLTNDWCERTVEVNGASLVG